MIRSIAFLRKRVGTSFGLNEYPHFCNMGINAAQVVLDLMAVSLAIELRKEGGGQSDCCRVGHLLYTYKTN